MLENTAIRILRGVFSSGTIIASGNQVRIEGYDYASGEWRSVAVTTSGEMAIHVTVSDIVTAKISGETVVVASGARVLVSGQMVQIASGARVLISGQMVQVASGAHIMISGQMMQVTSGARVLIGGYDYLSGEYRAVAVTTSGELAIHATISDIVRAQISGDTVVVASGARVLVSGQMVQVASGVHIASGARVLVSGQMVQVASGVHVMVSGQMVQVASGARVLIGGYDYLSGEYRAVAVTTSGELAIHATISDIVRAQISGDTVVVASGARVLVSGQMVQVASGVHIASGARVLVSGQMVQVASGVHIASGARVLVSGQMVQVASGPHVMVSGQMVQVASGARVSVSTISGATISIEVPTAIKTGALLAVTAASGGTIVTSGAVKSALLKSITLSADVFVGGSVAGQMPYSGYGFLLAQGEAVSLDINNFGRSRVCANVSGDLVTFIGVN